MSLKNKSALRRSNKVVVDTNLLLLVMFASLRQDPSNDKRLSRYAGYDLTLVERLIEGFSTLVVTPNILTECSNMTENYHEKTWLMNLISDFAEEYIPSHTLSSNHFFHQIGLTDTALTSNQLDDCCILTDDRELANILYSLEKDVIYYSEYRDHYRAANCSNLS